jgi:demethylmenaquinone methyltransferase/2-methoxy-6-polyprenyl-1,4-benzoquinol methylase
VQVLRAGGDSTILRDQVEYYRARAGEYDEWFLREGRYDRGPAHREAWFTEVALVETALRTEIPRGEVLEIACGTGLWTRHLAEWHSRIVAVDASPEVIAINRQRVRSDRVHYVVADIFTQRPVARFDAVFFGFWLSHVPADRVEAFWRDVRASLRDGGRVFFVDSLLEQSSTARDHDPPTRSGVVKRRLNDGREFDIVKIFYEPADLQRRLSALGWEGWIRSSGQFFVYGSLKPARSIGHDRDV